MRGNTALHPVTAGGSLVTKEISSLPEQVSVTGKGSTKPFPVTESVAFAIREHQANADNWPYTDLAVWLHHWVELFDLEFKLKLLSYPILKFAPLRNAYATYTWSRGEIGTRDNITFNTKELDRDHGLILRTLCHELLHLWQHYHGKPSKSRYHNVEFKNKALECGLIVNAWGCTSGHSEVFTYALAKHDVRLEPQLAERRLWGARKRAQKMLKWRCDCTTVRCAVRLRARCLECGIEFRSS